jgi:hypothetical protein
MIQPGRLRQFNSREIPPAIFAAWESHRAFVQASSFAAESIGIRFLSRVEPDTITLGFMRSMLEHNAIEEDLEWLIDRHVLEESDRSLWNLAVGEYAIRGLQ